MDCGTTDIGKGKRKKGYTKSHCPHGKQKSFYIPCGGNGICVHQKRKYTCKECKGSDICEHNIRKYECRERCEGGRFCDHGTKKGFARIVMVDSCTNLTLSYPKKNLSMMDTVSFAMSISFRIHLLHGTI